MYIYRNTYTDIHLEARKTKDYDSRSLHVLISVKPHGNTDLELENVHFIFIVFASYIIKQKQKKIITNTTTA